MDSFIPKIQFEARFTNLLDFKSIRNKLLAPFVKYVSSFSLSNEGTHSEGILLEFENDYFSIDCKWDRLILVSQYNLDRLGDKNSQISLFFEILKRFQDYEGFGKMLNYVCQIIRVDVGEESFENYCTRFRDKYLTETALDILHGTNDISIVLDKWDEDEKKIQTKFGPYHPNDINRHNLIPFPMEDDVFKDIRGKNGYINIVTLFESRSKIDQNVLKEAIQEIRKIKVKDE
ncbi:MAG: hypothetical protein BRD50_06410 [Bacteroidetes bacterium SW_11_45_7]|nr:MAG: hypothetical protein BRD50_06410 [Bacteroidetes bacterium SW_11_45_7]